MYALRRLGTMELSISASRKLLLHSTYFIPAFEVLPHVLTLNRGRMNINHFDSSPPNARRIAQHVHAPKVCHFPNPPPGQLQPGADDQRTLKISLA
jgi:hypothetical protein